MAPSPYLIGVALALMIPLGSCHRSLAPAAAGGAGSAALTADDMGYLAPPKVTTVETARGGALRIYGLAPPKATVEINAPEGEQVRAKADRRGRWSLTLPGGFARLYAISALLGSRTVHAEGALVTAPGALAQAVMVRAGYAALPLVSRPGFDIAAIDHDPEGAIAVAGDAPPGTKLTLSVDGTAAAVGQADQQGRYALMAANRRLMFGSHVLEVRGGPGVADRRVLLEPPTPLTAPYQAWATAQGWRVEWALNGGGVQTTLILAPGG